MPPRPQRAQRQAQQAINTDLAAVAAAEMERHIRGLVASVNLLRDRLGMDMLTVRHVQRPVRKER
jgi:hypothetical protein